MKAPREEICDKTMQGT